MRRDFSGKLLIDSQWECPTLLDVITVDLLRLRLSGLVRSRKRSKIIGCIKSKKAGDIQHGS